ncbi:MAG: hypothetical protein MUQ10_18610 [Anaerolineae bacterium]|nr:hypothetical protein [Anaerolineae bacterium]
MPWRSLRRRFPLPEIFLLPRSQIQPSQLYISSAKLAQVQAWWWPRRVEQLSPIPVVQLDGIIVATDGHTRASAAYRAGLRAIPVVWEADELDWDAYRACEDWCRAGGIRTVMDLEGRVVSPSAYEELWLDRCRRMHEELARTVTRGKGLKPGLPHYGSTKASRPEIFLSGAAGPPGPVSRSGGRRLG